MDKWNDGRRAWQTWKRSIRLMEIWNCLNGREVRTTWNLTFWKEHWSLEITMESHWMIPIIDLNRRCKKPIFLLFWRSWKIYLWGWRKQTIHFTSQQSWLLKWRTYLTLESVFQRKKYRACFLQCKVRIWENWKGNWRRKAVESWIAKSSWKWTFIGTKRRNQRGR